MPNKSAKSRKRNRRLLNQKMSREGRTAAQRKRYKRKLQNKESNENEA